MSERIAELETKLKDARAGGDEARSLLASATDLLNSWARESYTTEAKTEADIKGVIDRLWSYWSAEIARLRQCAKYESDVAAQSVTELDRMRKALEPFANCVFNDNGDLTIDQSHLHGGDWLRAYRALNQQPAQSEKP